MYRTFSHAFMWLPFYVCVCDFLINFVYETSFVTVLTGIERRPKWNKPTKLFKMNIVLPETLVLRISQELLYTYMHITLRFKKKKHELETWRMLLLFFFFFLSCEHWKQCYFTMRYWKLANNRMNAWSWWYGLAASEIYLEFLHHITQSAKIKHE